MANYTCIFSKINFLFISNKCWLWKTTKTISVLFLYQTINVLLKASWNHRFFKKKKRTDNGSKNNFNLCTNTLPGFIYCKIQQIKRLMIHYTCTISCISKWFPEKWKKDLWMPINFVTSESIFCKSLFNR